MNSAQASTIRVAIPAASYSAAVGSAAPIIDTAGFKYAVFTVQLGTVGAAFTVLKLEGSEVADHSTGVADISGCVASGSTGATRLPQNGDSNLFVRFYVPLNGTVPRYLRLAATPGGATVFSGNVQLSDAIEPASTRVERNNAIEFLRA